MLSVTASPQCLRAPIGRAPDDTAKYSTYLRTQLTYDSGTSRARYKSSEFNSLPRRLRSGQGCSRAPVDFFPARQRAPAARRCASVLRAADRGGTLAPTILLTVFFFKLWREGDFVQCTPRSSPAKKRRRLPVKTSHSTLPDARIMTHLYSSGVLPSHSSHWFARHTG